MEDVPNEGILKRRTLFYKKKKKKKVCKIFLKLFCWFDELYIKAGTFLVEP